MAEITSDRRVRLDRALGRLEPRGRAEPATGAQLERFDAVAPARRRPADPAAPRPGLAAEVLDFIMPSLDARVLHGAVYAGLLEALAAELAAAPPDDDPFARRGAAIVRHELRRHRLLLRYLNGLIEG